MRRRPKTTGQPDALRGRIISDMAIGKWIPWGVCAAVLVRTSVLWHGPATKDPAQKPPPTNAERAEAASLDPTTLIVDFRDDVSAHALAANGYTEIPISDYSARDRLYRIEFATTAEAAAAKARLARDPDV